MCIETLKLDMSLHLPKKASKKQDDAKAQQMERCRKHLFFRAAPFLDPIREDPTDMLFYAIGDKDAPYGVRPGKAGHLDTVIKHWLNNALETGFDVYGYVNDELDSIGLDGIVTVSYSPYSGQLWFAFYVDDRCLRDNRPLSTLYVCEPTEELG